MMDLERIIASTRQYNLHSHTEYCDGRNTMEEMARGALEAGMEFYGFTPHSPIPVESKCNMDAAKVEDFIARSHEIASRHAPQCTFLTGMEIDYLGSEWGPHLDYFQRMDLDYRIGSVHFVPTRDGVAIDCDGRYERFAVNLKEAFGGDLRYVVEKYFEQVITMTERGGFDILGHLDKIAGNASQAQPGIEDEPWYKGLIDHALSTASSAGVIVEINTKALATKGRFFPAARWIDKVMATGLPVAVNSDAHYVDKIDAGRREAFKLLDSYSSACSDSALRGSVR